MEVAQICLARKNVFHMCVCIRACVRACMSEDRLAYGGSMPSHSHMVDHSLIRIHNHVSTMCSWSGPALYHPTERTDTQCHSCPLLPQRCIHILSMSLVHTWWPTGHVTLVTGSLSSPPPLRLPLCACPLYGPVLCIYVSLHSDPSCVYIYVYISMAGIDVPSRFCLLVDFFCLFVYFPRSESVLDPTVTP